MGEQLTTMIEVSTESSNELLSVIVNEPNVPLSDHKPILSSTSESNASVQNIKSNSFSLNVSPDNDKPEDVFSEPEPLQLPLPVPSPLNKLLLPLVMQKTERLEHNEIHQAIVSYGQWLSDDLMPYGKVFFLLGKISQKFSAHNCPDRQCVAISAVATFVASLDNPRRWVGDTMDKIVELGDTYYSNSYRGKPYLIPQELNRIFKYPHYVAKLIIERESPILGPSTYNGILRGFKKLFCSVDNTISDIDEDIEYDSLVTITKDDMAQCKKNSDLYGIFVCNSKAFAIIKRDDGFYLFDSHSTDYKGAYMEAGSASIWEFVNIEALTTFMFNLVSSEAQFTIDPVSWSTMFYPDISDPNELPLVPGLRPGDEDDGALNMFYENCYDCESRTPSPCPTPPPVSASASSHEQIQLQSINPHLPPSPRSEPNNQSQSSVSLSLGPPKYYANDQQSKFHEELQNRPLLSFFGNRLPEYTTSDGVRRAYMVERTTSLNLVCKCRLYRHGKDNGKCKARLHIPIKHLFDETKYVPLGEHTCVIDPIEIQHRKTLQITKENVRIHPHTSTMHQIADHNANVTRPIIYLQSRLALERMVQRAKVDNIPSLPKFDDIHSLIIPDEFKKTQSGELFLLYDSDDGDELPNSRLVIFGTIKFLNLLHHVLAVFSDGTWKSCPNPFEQLYTWHGYTKSIKIPLLFCLVKGKTEIIYDHMIKRIDLLMQKHLGVNFHPKIFTTDMEKAVQNVIEKNHPDSEMHFCSYHFGHSLDRHLQQTGLWFLYQTQAEFTEKIRIFFSLQFLEPNRVKDTFRRLVEDKFFFKYENFKLNAKSNDSLVEFIQYYGKTWIGLDWDGTDNFQDYNARFKIETWNQYHRVLNGDELTNNFVEGWHYSLNKFMDTVHPSFQMFMHNLIEMQRENELFLAQSQWKESKYPSKKPDLSIDPTTLSRKQHRHDMDIRNYVLHFSITDEKLKDHDCIVDYLLGIGVKCRARNRDMRPKKVTQNNKRKENSSKVPSQEHSSQSNKPSQEHSDSDHFQVPPLNESSFLNQASDENASSEANDEVFNEEIIVIGKDSSSIISAPTDGSKSEQIGPKAKSKSVRDRTQDKFKCQYKGCDKSFNTKHHYASHDRIHRDARPFICLWPSCGYSSTDRSTVIRHIRLKHLSKENDGENVDPKSYLHIDKSLF